LDKDGDSLRTEAGEGGNSGGKSGQARRKNIKRQCKSKCPVNLANWGGGGNVAWGVKNVWGTQVDERLLGEKGGGPRGGWKIREGATF